MTNYLVRSVVIYWIVGIAAPAEAINYSLLVRVEQFNSIEGLQTFNFDLTLLEPVLPSNVDTTRLELVLPSGDRIGEGSPEADRIDINAEGVPAAAVGQWEGVWTIEETIGGGPTKQYSFQLPTFASSFLPTPVIYEPLSNANVPRVFDVRWTNPATFTTLIFNDIAVLPEVERPGPGHAIISTLNDRDFRPLTIEEFSLAVTNASLLAVTPIDGGTATFRSSMLRFVTHSAPITINVIPEPASLIILCLAAVAIGGRTFL